MFEIDMEAIQWFFVGIAVTFGAFLAFMILGLCVVAGRCSRLEEQRENRFKVENWKATPERLAMTERKK
jgi:hypothetical protein